MKELMERIAQAMVDYPDQVEVIEVCGSTITVIELKVAKSDIGKVIGKKGHNAEAIRIILEAAGKKLKRRVVLEILD